MKVWAVLLFIFFLQAIEIQALPDSLVWHLPDTVDIKNPKHLLDISTRSLENRDFQKAKLYLDECIAVSTAKKEEKILATARYYLADYYFFTQEYTKALELYKEVLPLFHSMQDTLMLAKSLNSVGLINKLDSKFDEALNYYMQVVELLDEETDSQLLKRELLVVLININNIYADNQQYEKVVEYSQKSITLAEEMKDSLRLGSALNTLGISYANLELRNKALATYKRSAEIFGKLNNSYRLAFVYNNIGNLYEKIGSHDSSLVYLYRSLEGFNASGYNIGTTQTLNGIGSVLVKLGRFDEAKRVLLSSVELAKANEIEDAIAQAYSHLADLEYKLGNFKAAYDYSALFHAVNDSIYSREQQEQLSELQVRFETTQKEREIEFLKKEKERQAVIIRKNRILAWLGFSISFLVIISIVFVAISLSQKNQANQLLSLKTIEVERQNEQLRAMNAEITAGNIRLAQSEMELSKMNRTKNLFFSILAHDLRNPFHTILGQSNLLADAYENLTEEERKGYAREIYGSGIEVFRLLDNLLEWSRTQTQSIEFTPRWFDLGDMANNTIELLRKSAGDKSIQIHNDISGGQEVYADISMIETVIRNLISNSIKFTKPGGLIRIHSRLEKNELVACVEDNGVGISEENIHKLFYLDGKNRSSGTNNEKGTGLGLVICKEFIDMHNGKIWAESSPGIGTRFYFSLPLNTN